MRIKSKNANIKIILIFLLFVFSILFLSFNEREIVGQEQINFQNSNEELTIFDTKEDYLNTLDSLIISEPENVDYNRDEQFGPWKTYSGWSTRDEVLKKYGTNTNDNGTSFTSGEWYILYTGENQTYNSKEDISNNLEIDHIVPLSYAYRHGAKDWDQDKREEFCNDYGNDTKWSAGSNSSFDYDNGYYGNLVVSDKYSNRSKSDKGPSEWMPPTNQLKYAEMWVDICNKYGVSITQEDYNVLLKTIENCN